MKTKRTTVVIVWALTICVAVGAGWFAANAALSPNQVDVLPPKTSTIKVVSGEISQTVEVPVFASWETAPIDRLQDSGVITAIHLDGIQDVKSGDKLYDLDLRPVVIAEGQLPLFRALDIGDRGADVTQVEEFLKKEGFLNRSTTQKYDQGLRQAVRAWQRSIGAPESGALLPGEILFTPNLPTRVAIDESLSVGDRVAADQSIAHTVSKTPLIEVVVEAGREIRIPSNSPIEIEGKDITWQAVTGETVTNKANEAITALHAVDDAAAVCGSECSDKIPFALETKLALTGEVTTTEKAVGALVPQAALRTDAQGNITVRTPANEDIAVTIVQQNAGQTIVDGVEIGTEIILFNVEQ